MLNSRLLYLCNINYETIDNGLISNFMKRWHWDTYTFHILVGEMNITLDNVVAFVAYPRHGTNLYTCDIGFHIYIKIIG